MPTSPTIRTIGGAVAALGLTFAVAPAAQAAPQPPVASPEQLDAMQRDLGLTRADAVDLIESEEKAQAVETTLRAALGDDFGGSHFDIEDRELTIQVTDTAAVEKVTATGADAEVVEHGEAELGRVMDTLDDSEAAADEAIAGWRVDPASDSVVVTVARGEAAEAEDFIAEAGVNSDAVTIEESAETPRTYADLVGGTPYYFQNGGSWYVCSVGIPVVGGYVTAGHCGDAGSTTWERPNNSTQIGTVVQSNFPGQDSGFVRVTNPAFTPVAKVDDYSGGTVDITGSAEAAVGASVCRSGQTTGWHCGTIESKNQTVRYPEGTVRGLTRTNVCAEGGDSGGSWVSGTQAQGVTSGGSGNCTWGGTTYFQPLNTILDQWNLTLLTR
ncbi:alpha-lytic protease prodomain-containing protein [Nocardiopsis rhodophaea]|uniref:Alpha-lytic protease prodomain-containing protein n=1 Tax=Nocardiopsis rhodophaea TaxID=280238 RepID=A0ABN2TR02_9ACTN